MNYFIKKAIVFSAIAIYGFGASSLALLPIAHHKKQWLRAHLTHYICRFGVWLLKIKQCGTILPARLRGELIVANHLSYIDILIIAAQVPTLFITSREVEKAPFIGLLAKWGGSIFVERRRNGNLLNEQAQIVQMLNHGYNITLFPEATSSDGTTVLPFKGGLIQVAIMANKAVLPLVLAYTCVNGLAPNRHLLDKVCYYGDMKFSEHIKSFLNLDSLTCQQQVLTPIAPQGSRKEFTAILHKLILNKYLELEVNLCKV